MAMPRSRAARTGATIWSATRATAIARSASGLDDLIHWTPFGTYEPDLADIPGLPHPLQRIGAPKLYFDAPSGNFLLTWHTPTVPGTPRIPSATGPASARSMSMSKDLKTSRAAAAPVRLGHGDDRHDRQAQ
jgi:hypothetical protein